MEKYVLVLDFISSQLGQFTTSGCTHQRSREPSSDEPKTTFTVNHKPHSNLYEEFKGFVEVTLYDINKWGCTLGWVSLDEVPYLIRKLIDQRLQGK